MKTGVIYFIQLTEFIGTNIYKIGMSQVQDLKGITHGCSKGRKPICVFDCIEPKKLECKIITPTKIKMR
jgi:hypothetical protein